MIAMVVVLLAGMAVLQFLLPFWWWIMAVPFVYGLISARSAGAHFFIGLLSAGLWWLAAGAYQLFTGGGMIAARVAQMLSAGSPYAALGLTVLFAMLAGGFAGAAGRSLRAAFVSAKDIELKE